MIDFSHTRLFLGIMGKGHTKVDSVQKQIDRGISNSNAVSSPNDRFLVMSFPSVGLLDIKLTCLQPHYPSTSRQVSSILDLNKWRSFSEDRC